MRQIFYGLLSGALALGFLSAGSAQALEVELVSKRMTNVPSLLGEVVGADLSADGNWAVLTVSADHPSEFVYSTDVFLRDLANGQDTLVSRSLAGGRGNDVSIAFGLSGDGQFVVFESAASDLVAGDGNEVGDVFIFDRSSGQIAAVSRTPSGFGNGESSPLAMSPDARFVVFESESDNLVTNDNNGTADIFLFDRVAGTIKLVTQSYLDSGTAPGAIPGQPLEASVSADGRYVAFLSSATNQAPFLRGLLDGQVYLRDMELATNRWLNHQQDLFGGRYASSPQISTNGEVVAFISADLFIGPASLQPSTFLYFHSQKKGWVINSEPKALGRPDVHTLREFDMTPDGRRMVAVADYQISTFGARGSVLEIYDNEAFTNKLVTLEGAGSMPRGSFANPRITDDGRWIFFTSDSPDLPGAVTNGTQVYKHDIVSGVTALVSTNALGRPSNGEISKLAIATNASRIVYLSTASDLAGNEDRKSRAYLAGSGLAHGPSELRVDDPRGAHASGDGGSVAPIPFPKPPTISLLSGDGRMAVFLSRANDLVPGDTNGDTDIFVRDLQRQQTRRVSTAFENQRYGEPRLLGASTDGSRIVWVRPVLTNKTSALFLVSYDTRTGENSVEMILPDGSTAGGIGGLSTMSADGRFVFFSGQIMYVRDLIAKQTVALPFRFLRLNRLLSPSGKYLIDQESFEYQRSPAVVYDLARWTSNLVDGICVDASLDDSAMLFRRNRGSISTGDLFLYHPVLNNSNTVGADADLAAMSGDGGTVVYRQMPPGTHPDQSRTYIYNANTGTHTLLLLGLNGPEARLENRPALSRDGRFVVFVARGRIGSPEAANVYVWDRGLQQLSTIGNPQRPLANFPAGEPWISADGQTVMFDSLAPDWVANDWNLMSDVFVARLGLGMRVAKEGNSVRVFWKGNGGRLQQAFSLGGEWTTILNAQEPHSETANAVGSKFFRVIYE